MEVQQVHTKKKYTMTAQEWESLGKRQKLFNVISENEAPVNVVKNIVPIGKGSNKGDKNKGQSQAKK